MPEHVQRLAIAKSRAQTGDSELVLAADTVVVIMVRQITTGRVDAAGSSVPDYEVVGSGDALVFRNGMVFEGEWVRDTQQDFFSFVDSEGAPIPLMPGRTWIHVMPTSGSVSWT